MTARLSVERDRAKRSQPRSDRRREKRDPLVRQVEINPFPRVLLAEGQQTGMTRDLSASGLCLRTEKEQSVGSLLRVVVRGVDGRPALESVGRVAWCRPVRGGACWVGLSLVATRSGLRATTAADGRRPSEPLGRLQAL
jgi:hypothetical protein